MSTTCQVCMGAIPDGEKVDGHTALCAEVLGQRYRARIAELETAIKRLLDGNRAALDGNLDALRDALDCTPEWASR